MRADNEAGVYYRNFRGEKMSMVSPLWKDNPIRSKKYLKWVRTLDCCFCGGPGGVAHHAIGVGEGGMGTKASDFETMPSCWICHDGKFHRLDLFPGLRQDQWRFVAKTLQKAIKDGIISEIQDEL